MSKIKFKFGEKVEVRSDFYGEFEGVIIDFSDCYDGGFTYLVQGEINKLNRINCIEKWFEERELSKK